MNEYSGSLAADHLLDLGHRDVGLCERPPRLARGFGSPRGFRERVLRTRRRDRVDAGRRLVRGTQGRPPGGGCTQAERTVSAIATRERQHGDRPDQRRSRGRSRGSRDLSVIGNDDIHEAQYLLPALSTVAVDFEAEGRVLIDQLLAQIDPSLRRERGTPPSLHRSRVEPVGLIEHRPGNGPVTNRRAALARPCDVERSLRLPFPGIAMLSTTSLEWIGRR